MHYYTDVVEREPRRAHAAWTARFAELQPRLVRALVATAGTYAGVEDAVQEAFAAGIAADLDAVANVGGWLYTVALRSLRRVQRRNAVARALHLPLATRSDLDVAIQRIDLLAALSKISRRDRELLVAKHYIGMTQEEIARAFDLPRGTVSAAISRAAARLREREERG